MHPSTLLLVTLAVGCASNDRLPTSETEYDDLAISLASTIHAATGHGELIAMGDALSLSRGLAQRLERGDIDYRYAVQCHDSLGELTSCAGATSAEVSASWSGAMALPDLDLTIEREGAWSLVGMGGHVTTLSGEGHMILQSVIANPDRGVTTYNVQYAATYAGVELARGATAPRAGTVTYAIDATRSRSMENTTSARDLSTDAVLTFVGDNKATLIFDEEVTYALDLSSGTLTRR